MTDSNQLSLGDFPNSVFDKEALQNGAVILPIIGIIYLYGAIYILNMKYFYPVIEHLIGLLNEKYAPLVYCSLNTVIYVFVMIYSCALAKDNFGIATILGTDAVNLLLTMAFIQFKVQTFVEIDTWIFLKDGTFYLGNLALAGLFFSYKNLHWWMSLVWFLYFAIYARYFQKKNDHLKDRIAILIGLKDEDDVFNVDENYKMIRRRNSISEIMEKDLCDWHDHHYLKRLQRNEGALRIQIKDRKKFHIYAHFQRLVFKVIFALEKKKEFEKRERSNLYREKVQKLVQIPPQKPLTELDIPQEDPIIEKEKREEEENLIGSEKKSDFPGDANVIEVHHTSHINQNAHDVLSKLDLSQKVREDQVDDDAYRNDDIAIPSHQHIDEEEVERQGLEIPKTTVKKVLFFTFFPFHLIYHLMITRFKKQLNFKAVGIAIGMCLGIQAGLAFLIVWWTTIITSSLSIQPEVAGLSWTSVGFSLSFLVYNLKLQENHHNANFLTTFQLIGIYKFGFAATVGWVIYFIISGAPSTDMITRGFQVSTFVYTALFLASMGLIGFFRAKIPKKMYIPYSVGYGIFVIVGIVLCSVFTSSS